MVRPTSTSLRRNCVPDRLGAVPGGRPYDPAVLSLPIVTPRLRIRPFEPGDERPMMDVYGDPEVMRYIPGGTLPDEQAVRTIMDEQLVAHAARGYAYYAVELVADGSLVGDAGFGLFEPTGDVELGYTFARRAWGQGYATEAAAACLEAGLAGLDMPRIIAVADVDNAASHRVAERIGMRRQGEIEAHGRPHVLFAVQRT
jgi:ribosomal-protein-alanine N-acetyltransferase